MEYAQENAVSAIQPNVLRRACTGTVRMSLHALDLSCLGLCCVRNDDGSRASRLGVCGLAVREGPVVQRLGCGHGILFLDMIHKENTKRYPKM